MKIIIGAEHFITLIRYLPETKSGVKNGRFTGAQIGDVTGDLWVINR
jgi:hypothetical protein